ncbi:MAG: HAMP domain-containing histidine kinase [Roseburia sp.]|nr:HAMP domain-containing histidine kinase [Roseburia sp.]
MNKIRGSYLAKLAAWLLFLIGGAGSVIFGMIASVYIGEGYYGKTYEEAKADTFRWVNAHYSVEAFRRMGGSVGGEALAQEYFRYGIIRTDGLSAADLEKLDFNARTTYADSNFFLDEDVRIDPDALEVYKIVRTGDHTEYYGMCGSYRECLDSLKRQEENVGASGEEAAGARQESRIVWQNQYADAVCYDSTGGIFYYRSEGMYYPVQNVTLCDYRGYSYNYSYDFEKEAYVFNYRLPAAELDEVPEDTTGTMTFEVGEADAPPDAVETILWGNGTGTMLTFDALDATVFDYRSWGVLLLDNVREIGSGELSIISRENIPENLFITDPGYYLNENYTLVVAKEAVQEHYWVVSLIPDKVPADSDNTYAVQQWILDTVYAFDVREIARRLVGFVLLAVLSAVFLIVGAGHRRNREEIVLTPCPDRIPFEIWTAVCIVAVSVLCMLWVNYLRTLGYLKLSVAALTLVVLAIAAIALWYVLSLAARVKYGKWWHNTICYFIYSRIRRLLSTLCANLDILWKLIVGGVALIVLELLVALLALDTEPEMYLAFHIVKYMVIGAFLCRLALQVRRLQEGSRHLADGELRYQINTEKMFPACRAHGENLNRIGVGMTKAVDERMRSERLKTELITNVSHDIKTPLTSIINYVDLLGKEELHNEKAEEYLEVLERQSSKLKKLIEDLVEASKASTGNLPVTSELLEVGVFLTQTVGEFEERLGAANLELIVRKTEEPVYIEADGRHLWRVADNLMNNICKYAQPYSRVYVNLEQEGQEAVIIFRNISREPLNVSGEELTERFVRGDRSRNTEGHGLGLSIARSLMELMSGSLEICVDGDLFKVLLRFPRREKPEAPENI